MNPTQTLLNLGKNPSYLLTIKAVKELTHCSLEDAKLIVDMILENSNSLQQAKESVTLGG